MECRRTYIELYERKSTLEIYSKRVQQQNSFDTLHVQERFHLRQHEAINEEDIKSFEALSIANSE